MKTAILFVLALGLTMVLADEQPRRYTIAPTAEQIGRFQVMLMPGNQMLRLDTVTGSTWQLLALSTETTDKVWQMVLEPEELDWIKEQEAKKKAGQ
jgi:hypothetical protein